MKNGGSISLEVVKVADQVGWSLSMSNLNYILMEKEKVGLLTLPGMVLPSELPAGVALD